MTEHFLPDAKVMIIVEGLSEVTRIHIPLASKPSVAFSDTYSLHTGAPAEKLLGFNCYALYDIDHNMTHHIESKSRFEAENDIIIQAKAILQRRQDESDLLKKVGGV